jgi:mono/diheme cytochrome c family protein
VQFKSIGERIYYTGAGESGDPIPFADGPHWVYMHGGSCVNCHGPDGKGGIRVHMTREIAPDIRYSVLTSAKHEHEEHPPYTDELIERAITQGLDSAGKPLDRSMPRWQMSRRDLDHLIEYLKTLDGRQK